MNYIFKGKIKRPKITNIYSKTYNGKTYYYMFLKHEYIMDFCEDWILNKFNNQAEVVKQTIKEYITYFNIKSFIVRPDSNNNIVLIPFNKKSDEKKFIKNNIISLNDFSKKYWEINNWI